MAYDSSQAVEPQEEDSEGGPPTYVDDDERVSESVGSGAGEEQGGDGKFGGDSLKPFLEEQVCALAKTAFIYFLLLSLCQFFFGCFAFVTHVTSIGGVQLSPPTDSAAPLVLRFLSFSTLTSRTTSRRSTRCSSTR